jgi:hypothetical protein
MNMHDVNRTLWRQSERLLLLLLLLLLVVMVMVMAMFYYDSRI